MIKFIITISFLTEKNLLVRLALLFFHPTGPFSPELIRVFGRIPSIRFVHILLPARPTDALSIPLLVVASVDSLLPIQSR
jgi:hypothetical protein